MQKSKDSSKNCFENISLLLFIADANESYTCECSSRQCEWYLFDNELVLSVYIIEFEYIPEGLYPFCLLQMLTKATHVNVAQGNVNGTYLTMN